jgi:hypothetical protein
MRTILTIAAAVLCAAGFTSSLLGWGGGVHRAVNGAAVHALPRGMALFIADSARLAQRAGDADARKNPDDTSFTAEATRHYIDIDDYPDFRNLPHDAGACIAAYGWTRVKENGVLPWAIAWSYDSLVAQLRRGDWSVASQTASDLGHYAGDAAQPLHATRNYDGQETQNGGIHSRYESTMLGSQYYASQVAVACDSVRAIADPLAYAFAIILRSNGLVPGLLRADDSARALSGWNGSGKATAAYYAALWSLTREMTLVQLRAGAQATADLWYTAACEAGLILPAGIAPAVTRPADLHLAQNYPNPASGVTTLSYVLPAAGSVDLALFDVAGRRVATIAAGLQGAGPQCARIDASRLAAGVYMLRLRLGAWTQERRMVVAR